MSLNSVFQFFVPKDKKFFPLFEQAATKLTLLAETLHEAVNAPAEERETYFKKIEELAKSDKTFEAYDLALQVKKYLPDDTSLAKLLPMISAGLQKTLQITKTGWPALQK